MKLFVVACLIAFARAEDANTVADGVQTAANEVAGALPDVVGALGSTFQDVWNVAKDPLEQKGKELIKDAAELALQEAMRLAIDTPEAGKRDVPQQDILKQLMYAAAIDEYNHWIEETKKQILDSKSELQGAMGRFRFQDMPKELKNYLSGFLTAKALGKSDEFIVSEANTAYTRALANLKHRLESRMRAVIGDVFTRD